MPELAAMSRNVKDLSWIVKTPAVGLLHSRCPGRGKRLRGLPHQWLAAQTKFL